MTCPHHSCHSAFRPSGNSAGRIWHCSYWRPPERAGVKDSTQQTLRTYYNFDKTLLLKLMWWFCPHGTRGEAHLSKRVRAGSSAAALPCNKIDLNHIKTDEVFKPCEARAEWNGGTPSVCWVVFCAPCQRQQLNSWAQAVRSVPRAVGKGCKSIQEFS